jgi:hypothetical protein
MKEKDMNILLEMMLAFGLLVILTTGAIGEPTTSRTDTVYEKQGEQCTLRVTGQRTENDDVAGATPDRQTPAGATPQTTVRYEFAVRHEPDGPFRAIYSCSFLLSGRSDLPQGAEQEMRILDARILGGAVAVIYKLGGSVFGLVYDGEKLLTPEAKGANPPIASDSEANGFCEGAVLYGSIHDGDLAATILRSAGMPSESFIYQSGKGWVRAGEKAEEEE